MVETVDVNALLIEGFDSSKLEQKLGYDKDWQKVISARQNGTILQAEVGGFEHVFGKDCAVINIGKIRGYIPLEFSGVNTLPELRNLSGNKAVFKVLEYIEQDGKKLFIASRTDALDTMAEITLRRIKAGDEIIAVVSSIGNKYLLADIGGIKAILPQTELRYGWIDDLTLEVKVGDHLRVKVLEIEKAFKEVDDPKASKKANAKKDVLDAKKTKVVISAKALQENPWEDCLKRYKRGGEYVGTVSGVREFGVFVRLEDGVDSLASNLKFQNVKHGDKVLVRVNNLSEKEQQVRVKIVRVL